MEKTLALHNKPAFIVPFRDVLENDSECAWVYFNGIKQLYTDELKEILEYEGYIITDQRSDLKAVVQKEEDLY